MGLKFLIVLIGLVSSALAQVQVDSTLTCTYVNTAAGYGCNLQFNNSLGRDDFTEVRGVHLEGRTNADVQVILSTSGLTSNVPQIVCNQFENLEYFDLTNLGISTVSENAFRGCRNLRWLRLWQNIIWQLPANVFESNTELIYIDLDTNWLSDIPAGIFAPLVNLQTLELQNNFLNSIPDDTFTTLGNLRILMLNNCGLTTLNPSWFATLTSLEQLNLYRNFFTTIDENIFENLSNLTFLDLAFNSGNGLTIHPNAFRALRNLRQLNLNNAGLLAVDPSWFETLTSLNYLYLSFNRIEELPVGVFENLNELRSLSLWANELKFIRRASFGTLSTLTFLDLEDNSINAVDESFFEDATDLRTAYMSNNVCVNSNFFDFINNREVIFTRMRNCFCNFLHYVEFVSEGAVDSVIFRAFEPGMAFRVNGTNYIIITLMPVDFIAVPRISIMIGTSNGTRSAIRVNGDADVVDIPTPGVLDPLRWTDFRIVWANWMVSVFREQDRFPFMVWNVQEFYPITHYNVMSPLNRASWNIQPLELPADTDTC